MKKFTLYSFALSVICLIIAAVTAATVGEEGFKKFSQAAVEQKLAPFTPKLHELVPPEGQEAAAFDTLEILSHTTSVKIVDAEDDKLQVEYPEFKNEKLSVSWSGKKVTSDIGEYFSGEDKNKLVMRVFGKQTSINITSANSYEVVYFVPKSIKHVIFNSESADIKIQSKNLKECELRTVSGNVRFEGAAEKAAVNTVSGNIKWNTEASDPVLKLSTVSGDFKINFRKAPDFKVSFNTVSGSLKMDIDDKKTRYDKDNSMSVGSGKGQIDLKTVSGDVKIKYLKSEAEEL